MTIGFECDEHSERWDFVYTPEMHNLGINNFPEHLKQLAERGKDEDFKIEWQINNFNDIDLQINREYLIYKYVWSDRWNEVKHVICGPEYYNCELLEMIDIHIEEERKE